MDFEKFLELTEKYNYLYAIQKQPIYDKNPVNNCILFK